MPPPRSASRAPRRTDGPSAPNRGRAVPGARGVPDGPPPWSRPSNGCAGTAPKWGPCGARPGSPSCSDATGTRQAKAPSGVSSRPRWTRARSPQPAPQPAPRRPARQALRRTPAQGTQSRHPRRDRPTRHPHRLVPPRPARHRAVRRPRPRREVDPRPDLAPRRRTQRPGSPGLRGPTGATVPARPRQAPGRHARFPIERIDRWIDAFADESDAFRPRRALGGRTPARYLAEHAAEEPLPSHSGLNRDTSLRGEGGGWQDRVRPARGERHSAPTRCWREPWE